MKSYGICLSLIDLFHLVLYLLGLSMLLQRVGASSFSLLHSIPLCKCTIVLMHSFTDGHLGCFHSVAIVNNAAINREVHIFFWISVLGFFRYILRSGLLGYKADPFLTYWGPSILLSTVAAPVCSPTNSALGFVFLCILSDTCSLLLCLWWPFSPMWSGISLWF